MLKTIIEKTKSITLTKRNAKPKVSMYKDVFNYYSAYFNQPTYTKSNIYPLFLIGDEQEQALELIQRSMDTITEYSKAYRSYDLKRWNVKTFGRNDKNVATRLTDLKDSMTKVVAYRNDEEVYLGLTADNIIIEKTHPNALQGTRLDLVANPLTMIKVLSQ